MFPRSILISTILVIVALSAIPALQADTKTERAAITAAGAWLDLVDQDHYSDSWDQAASFFQGAVDRDTWVKSMQAVRKPLGKVISRKLYAKKITETLPGAPDGQYVVIQFKTVFEFKKISVETITPMLDKDGQWKVSGYYIR